MGGAVGGVAALSLIALIVFLCIRRTKKNSFLRRRGSSTEPVNYANLNSSFAGVPYEQGYDHYEKSNLSRQLSSPIDTHVLTKSHSGMDTTMETDQFLSQYTASGGDTPTRQMSVGFQSSNTLNSNMRTSPGNGLDSTPDQDTYQMTTPISPTKSFEHEHQLNGMPSVATPQPRRSVLDQNVVGKRIDHEELGRESAVLGRSISQRTVPESPISEFHHTARGSPVSYLDAQDTVNGNGITRNTSQRTVSSVESEYYDRMISDEELDRLGIGKRIDPE